MDPKIIADGAGSVEDATEQHLWEPMRVTYETIQAEKKREQDEKKKREENEKKKREEDEKKKHEEDEKKREQREGDWEPMMKTVKVLPHGADGKKDAEKK